MAHAFPTETCGKNTARASSAVHGECNLVILSTARACNLVRDLESSGRSVFALAYKVEFLTGMEKTQQDWIDQLLKKPMNFTLFWQDGLLIFCPALFLSIHCNWNEENVDGQQHFKIAEHTCAIWTKADLAIQATSRSYHLAAYSTLSRLRRPLMLGSASLLNLRNPQQPSTTPAARADRDRAHR